MIKNIYDLQFNEAEKRQINRLRHLDARRNTYALVVGIVILIVVFCTQIPFHGTNWLHALASYGCIPAGVAAGLYTNNYIDRYVENQFKRKWDPIYFKRKGTSPAHEAAREEIVRLTDDISFYALSEEQQKVSIKKIYQKYGL